MAKDDTGLSENLRILSVVTRFGAGGPPISVVRTARGLAPYGYETVISAGPSSERDSDMPYLLNGSDKVEWITAMSKDVATGSDCVALFQLIRLIRRYRPDIIHTHTTKAGVLGRLAGWLTGTPVIVHTFHGSLLKGCFSAVGSWCARKAEQTVALISDALLVRSPQQKKEITEECGIGRAEKVRIVPLGVPLDDFSTMPPPSLERPELVVGWFGRFVAAKNVPLLVKIVRETLKASQRVRFLIAGDGPERLLVEDLVRVSNGRVEFLGWLKDLAPAMSRCDLLIQTSINEGTPTALIQGMAAARPFVSTTAGGVAEMVTGTARMQDHARWFANAVLAPGEATPFATAILSFLKNRSLLRKMGMAARALALDRYSEKKMLDATHELYLQKLEEKGRRVPARLREQLAEESSMSQELARLAQQCGYLVATSEEVRTNR